MSKMPKENVVTFDKPDDLIPVDPVHVSIHLSIYIRPDFKPVPNEQEAFRHLLDKMNDAILEFKQELGVIEEGTS